MPETPNPEARRAYRDAERAKYSLGHLGVEIEHDAMLEHRQRIVGSEIQVGYQIRQRVGHWLFVFEEDLPAELPFRTTQGFVAFINTRTGTLYAGNPEITSEPPVLYDHDWFRERNQITQVFERVLREKGVLRHREIQLED